MQNIAGSKKFFISEAAIKSEKISYVKKHRNFCDLFENIYWTKRATFIIESFGKLLLYLLKLCLASEV